MGRPPGRHSRDKVELIYTAPQEFFFTQVKLAMFGGLVIAFPLIAAQIYKFVAPGLYRNERAAFLPFLIASPILFLMGGALVYFFFTPMVMWFFLAMQQSGTDGGVQISLLPKVSEYLSLIMTLIFSFGLVFQLPVVTTLLARVGIVTAQGLRDKRKWAIVIAFVVAAVLTPPDPLSQIGLALPTILLYEISIWSAGMVEKKREEEKLAAEAERDDARGDRELGCRSSPSWAESLPQCCTDSLRAALELTSSASDLLTISARRACQRGELLNLGYRFQDWE